MTTRTASLILTSPRVTRILYQLWYSGSIRTTVESRRSHDYDSPEIWGLKQLGQWTHLVSVIDNQAGYVTHYANGRELSREPLVKPIKLRIGDAEIGNWKGPILENGKAMPNVDQIIRNFNGRIDEFIIMGQALGKEEIDGLYNKGRGNLSLASRGI